MKQMLFRVYKFTIISKLTAGSKTIPRHITASMKRTRRIIFIQVKAGRPRVIARGDNGSRDRWRY